MDGTTEQGTGHGAVGAVRLQWNAVVRGTGALRCLRRRRWRRGFSLFGVLLGLTLAAVVIVGAVSLYNAARESANRSQALALLNQLRANVESVFAGAPSYGNNANLIATVDKRGGIPDSARVVNGNTVQIRHPFGGLVTITGGPGGETNQFRIVFRDVDDEVCAAMGDAYAGRTRARAGIVSMTVNGSTLASPVTVAQVTANCDDGAGDNNIGFTFG
ncbi:MAG: type 4 pilus major pilin [Alphaproteobacteria bacterium]|nr:type 4 pilus major pilin [Alphaproteobacteria bacterium]